MAPFLLGDRGSRGPKWCKAVRVCSALARLWILHFMWNIDRLQDTYGFGPRMSLRDLQMRTGDSMRTRVYHGMIDDEYGPAMISLIGADGVLWGSDFPHMRSLGLEAQEHVRAQFDALPRADQEQVVRGNAAQVFHVA